ncbi:MAG: hypoxanthine phosphoribosyltransferase [Oscillospiraceae bacterium]|nr:hypoxanthine phosphoribosyltransferase [Oscillospiraceae bacterium]
MSEYTRNAEEILITKEQLSEKIKQLGADITKDYKDKKLLLISILKGSVVFLADLMREIRLPLEIDFMCISSYQNSTQSSGNVKILKDLSRDIKGFDVLIVEDILDTGLTLSYLIPMLLDRKPESLKICTLLDKPSRRRVPVQADYAGFRIDDSFIVGYGLDYAEHYRNLDYIGIYKESNER